MNSPFPGMDPYIEGMGLWEDFHHNLITEIQGAISAALPERYVVRAGERSAPIIMRALVETEYREGFLEIRELNPERKLVTCIEALSPSNKRSGSEGWERYKSKRQAYLEVPANFVEIDRRLDPPLQPAEVAWLEEQIRKAR